jgi:hypothetical protein
MRPHKGISPVKFYSVGRSDLLLVRLKRRQFSPQRTPTLRSLLFGFSPTLSLLRTLLDLHGLLDRPGRYQLPLDSYLRGYGTIYPPMKLLWRCPISLALNSVKPASEGPQTWVRPKEELVYPIPSCILAWRVGRPKERVLMGLSQLFATFLLGWHC